MFKKQPVYLSLSLSLHDSLLCLFYNCDIPELGLKQVCSVFGTVDATYVSQFRDVLGISTETKTSLGKTRPEYFFVDSFTLSDCKTED